MKLVPVTEAQASFLYVEVAGRYIDDEDAARAAVAALVLEHVTRKHGGGMAVPSETLVEMLLDVANAIDDECEAASKGDARALGRIGGADTLADARRLHRTAEALLAKARRALSAR